MRCFVYLVRCNDGMYYTGITWNLEKRIAEHNSGINAAKREKEIKGWRREKKELLIASLHLG